VLLGTAPESNANMAARRNRPANAALASCLAVLALVAASDLCAQSARPADGSGEEESRRNHVSLFLGATTETGEESATSFTVGADYERRLSDLWGVGFLVDFALGDVSRTSLLGVPVYLHPIDPLEVHVAPGVEFSRDEDTDDTDGGEGETDTETKFAVRVGTAYEFEIGRLVVSPEVNLDFVAGDSPVIVYGLAFGFDF